MRDTNVRRNAATDPKPHFRASSFSDSPVSVSNWQAFSRRAQVTYSPGALPVS